MVRSKNFLLLIFCLMTFSQLHADIREISISELEQLKKIGVIIIDIRKQEEIDKTGVIPTSYKLNFYKKDGTINRIIWLKRFIDLVKGKYIKFVLISTDGHQAKLGANILYDQKGYKNPFYLKGGMENWLKNNKKTFKKKDKK